MTYNFLKKIKSSISTILLMKLSKLKYSSKKINKHIHMFYVKNMRYIFTIGLKNIQYVDSYNKKNCLF